MVEQLPIKQIFVEGIKMPFIRYRELIRLGWPYASLLLVLPFLFEDVDVDGALLYFTLSALIGALGMVRCHRVFLLSDEVVRETSVIGWGSRETRFMLRLIGIGILLGIITIPLFLIFFPLIDSEIFTDERNQLIAGITIFLILVPVYYIFSRLSLIFPSIAVDQNRPLLWAWDSSSNCSFRLFVLVGAIPLITSFLLDFVVILDSSTILVLVQILIWLVVAVIEICFLSLSYEWVVSRQQTEGAPP